MSYTGMSYDDWQDLQKVQKEKKPPKKPPKPTKPDKSDKKGDNGDSDSTKNKVQGVIDGASKVLGTLQAAHAKSQVGLGNLNKTGYDDIRDPGYAKGESAIIGDADKEYQQAKAKIDKEDKKNGYA